MRPRASQRDPRARPARVGRFTPDDAMRYLEQSEERMPSPPKGYSLTNRSMIGRLKLNKGKKAEVPAHSAHVRPSSVHRVCPCLPLSPCVRPSHAGCHQAREWLEKALALEESGVLLDDSAREAAADARKALKKC